MSLETSALSTMSDISSDSSAQDSDVWPLNSYIGSAQVSDVRPLNIFIEDPGHLALILQAQGRSDLYTTLALYQDLLLIELDSDVLSEGQQWQFDSEFRKSKFHDILSSMELSSDPSVIGTALWWTSSDASNEKTEIVQAMRRNMARLLETYLKPHLNHVRAKYDEDMEHKLWSEIILFKRHRICAVEDFMTLLITRGYTDLTAEDIDFLWSWIWASGCDQYVNYDKPRSNKNTTAAILQLRRDVLAATMRRFRK